MGMKKGPVNRSFFFAASVVGFKARAAHGEEAVLRRAEAGAPGGIAG